VPLADLFYLGTKGSRADASNIISAFYVSDSTINGAVCAAFTFTPPEDAKKIEMVGGEPTAPQASPGP
jgi:hypothetical protein